MIEFVRWTWSDGLGGKEGKKKDDDEFPEEGKTTIISSSIMPDAQ